ncbi:hypothetical protein ACFXB3_07205 [Streptomyces sp. NPDC059447]|uniref:hypothetical protein n=1 Tax=Streptomyces sp. NPDC059447 TaxID=3346834 RepID=UPI003680F4F2
MTSQPAEHCGAILPGIWEQPPTECVLRPGHQGSHANHDGARWIETTGRGYCPHCGRGDCAPTPDDYEQARRRAVRIQTLLDDTRDRVRKLHQRYADGTCFADGDPYPCPTITALEPPKEQS